MRKYEFLMIIKPNLEKAIEEEFIKNFEQRLGGNIVKKDDWGLRKLAYPIKKEQEAHYILYFVEAEPENVIKTREWLNIRKELLRSMVLVHEKKWPTEMKTSKELKFPERKKKIIPNKNN